MEQRFYKIAGATNSAVVPALLQLLKTCDKAVIYCSKARTLEQLDDALWQTEDRTSFIPHGTAAEDPVQLVTELPTDAEQVICLDVPPSLPEGFKAQTCHWLFCSNQTNLKNARTLWKEQQSAGANISYWSFEAGSFQQKS